MATLTSTGAVNLTSSTNWSPAQIPAAGDDLVIGAHTLTLDADFTGAGALNTVTFNSTSSRLAISGTTRSVQATNGWIHNVSATLCSTSITIGMTVTLIGKWSLLASQSAIFQAINGGTVNLWTVNSDPTSCLIRGQGNYAHIAPSAAAFSAGILNTIGWIDHIANGWNYFVFLGASSTWNHNNSGAMSYFNAGGFLVANGTGGNLNWTGDLTVSCQQGGNVAAAFTGNFATLNTNGNFYLPSALASANSQGCFVNLSAGAWTHTGRLSSKNKAITAYIGGGAIFNWKNQNITIASDEQIYIGAGSGTVDLSGLKVTNNNRFIIYAYGSSAIVVDSNTLITNTSISTYAAAIGSTALDSKIITLASPSPTLPAVSNVTAGITYGYSGVLSTGTALLVDPAILASAISSSTVGSGVTQIKSKTDQLAFTVPNQVDSNSLTGGLTQSQVRSAVGLASANLDTQLSGISNNSSAIKSKTDQFVFTVPNQVDSNSLTGGLTESQVRSAVGLSSGNLDTQLSGISTNVNSLNSRTLPSGEYLTQNTPLTVSAINQSAVEDIFSTFTIPESYALSGSGATPAQMLYFMQQTFSQFDISGVYISVKKLDGTTEAAKFLMNDAETPTSRVRIS